MLEDMALSAAQLLVILFWTTLVFIVFWGAWWLRSLRSAKGKE